jgi:AcrR family transcriptional regulator
MRSDAARNLHRIVEVAGRLLAEHPQLSMADVATAAGVSRATVYRHFATREALIDAIRRQAVGRAAVQWLDVARRYSFAQLAGQPGSDEARATQRRIFREPLTRLIERGQAAGEFSAQHSPAWAVQVFGALLLAAVRAVQDGTLPEDEAAGALLDTLLKGLRG